VKWVLGQLFSTLDWKARSNGLPAMITLFLFAEEKGLPALLQRYEELKKTPSSANSRLVGLPYKWILVDFHFSDKLPVQTVDATELAS